MRKNAPRKWLHAILDLLPVIMIPVFMIYSHRHDIDTYTLNVAENKVVDFNQQFNLNVNENTVYGIKVSITNNLLSLDGTFNDNQTRNLCTLNYNGVSNHIFLIKNGYINQDIHVYQNGASYDTHVGNDYRYTCTSNSYSMFIYCANNFYQSSVNFTGILNCFDLTQMFGAGNEPTIQQFNEWYPNNNYNYTLSHKELIKNYSTVAYNDTDIMSQFTYNMYNSVDKYFNMNNVFGMTGVYDWFNLNIFNGNAPLYVYIVWNVILYEFVLDLLFLLYALFMFFIDFCTSLIERCYVSGKGGK